jgi:hypothetical protein
MTTGSSSPFARSSPRLAGDRSGKPFFWPTNPSGLTAGEQSSMKGRERQESAGIGAATRIENEQNFKYQIQAEHSPEEHGMLRVPFSFWKEIDFQAVLM